MRAEPGRIDPKVALAVQFGGDAGCLTASERAGSGSP